ncbi:MAG TPA: hypothetical protein VM364_05660 [Vicinamibacterales bacterium]|nr:hypothetical protein [Vicinamibacterales bacterium]
MSARSRSGRVITTVAVAAACLSVPAIVSAQAAAGGKAPKAAKEPAWTIEAFGGYALSPSAPTGTTSPQFPAGPTFTTEGGFTSRAVPSWYFGDGAALFNQTAAQFGSRFGVQIPPIVALDAMLGAAGRQEEPGVSFGARITRRLTPRVALEFGFQRSQARAGLTRSARTAIEASRASFETSFRGLLNTLPQTDLQVTSAVEGPGEVTATRTVISGALNVGFVRSGAFGAHVTVGAGRAASSGGALTARLRGNYQFRFLDVNPITESDTVTIRMPEQDSAVIGIFGGGFTYDVTRRQGLRMDVRVHAGRSGQTVSVDASPAVAHGGPALALPSATNPSIQFSNTAALPSSLSGTTSNLQTFTADGLEVRPHLTLSYFVRF